jgi:hypothetical protein
LKRVSLGARCRFDAFLASLRDGFGFGLARRITS